MNPVLLKPESETRAQVILRGRVLRPAEAESYQGLKSALLPAVLESFDRLRTEADLVLVEGAGSPAEVNLREGDIANMGFAETADVPVVLVGDIDRGGVIAAMVGTWELLQPSASAPSLDYVGASDFSRPDTHVFAATRDFRGLRALRNIRDRDRFFNGGGSLQPSDL